MRIFFLRYGIYYEICLLQVSLQSQMRYAPTEMGGGERETKKKWRSKNEVHVTWYLVLVFGIMWTRTITHFARCTTSALSSRLGVCRLSTADKSIVLRSYSTEKKVYDLSILDQSLVNDPITPKLATTPSRIFSSKSSAGDEEGFSSDEDDNDEGYNLLGESEERKATCTNKVCLALKIADFIYII